jgi:hypothetical protein
VDWLQGRADGQQAYRNAPSWGKPAERSHYFNSGIRWISPQNVITPCRERLREALAAGNRGRQSGMNTQSRLSLKNLVCSERTMCHHATVPFAQAPALSPMPGSMPAVVVQAASGAVSGCAYTVALRSDPKTRRTKAVLSLDI